MNDPRLPTSNFVVTCVEGLRMVLVCFSRVECMIHIK